MTPPPPPDWLPEILREPPKDLSLNGSAPYRDAFAALTPEQTSEFKRWLRATGVVSDYNGSIARVGYAACRAWQPDKYPLAWGDLPEAEALRYREWAIAAREYAYSEGLSMPLFSVAKDAPPLFLGTVAAVALS